MPNLFKTSIDKYLYTLLLIIFFQVVLLITNVFSPLPAILTNLHFDFFTSPQYIKLKIWIQATYSCKLYVAWCYNLLFGSSSYNLILDYSWNSTEGLSL